MLEYIYVCRHGFRSNWIDESLPSGPTGIPRDHALAAHGVKQAHHAADFFFNSSDEERQGPLPEKVFASPFYRCVETALPTAQGLEKLGKANGGIGLEHGIAEWYSTANPGTGLHPRASSSPDSYLFKKFQSHLDSSYSSTVYPSRKGESMEEVQDRIDLFVEAWTNRVEEMGLKSVVIWGHAATVIAVGRALTGDKSLDAHASPASISLYKRKTSSNSNGQVANGVATNGNGSKEASAGTGEWEPVFLARTDFMGGGSERDWTFRDAAIDVNGQVINDNGEGEPDQVDVVPTGLAPGMEKYLPRGAPEKNEMIYERQVWHKSQAAKM